MGKVRDTTAFLVFCTCQLSPSLFTTTTAICVGGGALSQAMFLQICSVNLLELISIQLLMGTFYVIPLVLWEMNPEKLAQSVLQKELEDIYNPICFDIYHEPLCLQTFSGFNDCSTVDTHSASPPTSENNGATSMHLSNLE